MLGLFIGSCFIKTDQLDGETDWKLRTALPLLQQLQSDEVCVCVCVCVCVYVCIDIFH